MGPTKRQQKRSSDSSYVAIWETVRKIPHGCVASYGDVAKVAGFDGHARLVGYALHNLPDGFDVPWHRVVNANMKISFPAGSGIAKLQRELLGREGVNFHGEVIDNKFRWHKVSGSRRRNT